MSYLDNLYGDDPVWDAIEKHTGAISRRGSGKWQFKLNCPMCVTRGTSADRRYRCGIAHDSAGIGINCFNCNFHARFSAGQPLSRGMMEFLTHIGVPERDVKTIRLWAYRQRGPSDAGRRSTYVPPPAFADGRLPEGAQSLERWALAKCDDPDFLAVVAYLDGRGEVIRNASQFYWSPEWPLRRRLIIPCIYDDRLVGWTGRSIDPDERRKYDNHTPSNFLFNAWTLSQPARAFVIIVEGIFDALAIDGIAAMGANLNDVQLHWIKQAGKTPIVVPDRDDAGRNLVEVAKTQKWAVAFPNYGKTQWWNNEVKDADEAVRKYGKLYTIQSIIASAVTDQKQINQRISFNHTRY